MRDLFGKPQVSEDKIHPKKIKTMFVIQEITFTPNIKVHGLVEKSEACFVIAGNKMHKTKQTQTLLEQAQMHSDYLGWSRIRIKYMISLVRQRKNKPNG